MKVPHLLRIVTVLSVARADWIPFGSSVGRPLVFLDATKDCSSKEILSDAKRDEDRPSRLGGATRGTPHGQQAIISRPPHRRRELRARSELDGGPSDTLDGGGQEPTASRPVAPSPKPVPPSAKDFMPFMTDAEKARFVKAGKALTKYHVDRVAANEEVASYGRIVSDQLHEDLNYGKARMTEHSRLRTEAIRKLVASDQAKPEWKAYWEDMLAKGRVRAAQWRQQLPREVIEADNAFRQEKRAIRMQRIAALDAKVAAGVALDGSEEEELKRLKGQLRADADRVQRGYQQRRETIMQERAIAQVEEAALERQIRRGQYSVQEFQRWEELIPKKRRAKLVREMKEFRVAELEARDPTTLNEQERAELARWGPEIERERERIRERDRGYTQKNRAKKRKESAKQPQSMELKVRRGEEEKKDPDEGMGGGGGGVMVDSGGTTRSTPMQRAHEEGSPTSPADQVDGRQQDDPPQPFSFAHVPFIRHLQPFSKDVPRRYDQLVTTILHGVRSDPRTQLTRLGTTAGKVFEGIAHHVAGGAVQMPSRLVRQGAQTMPRPIMVAP